MKCEYIDLDTVIKIMLIKFLQTASNRRIYHLMVTWSIECAKQFIEMSHLQQITQ